MGYKNVISGIYMIKNKANNKIYIGSSSNIQSRWKQHISDLKNKRHHNRYLQFSWDKYGEDNFIFELVELTNADKVCLLEREQHWLDSTKSYLRENGYNINLKAESCLGVKRRPLTKEEKEKLSEILRGENGANAKLTDEEVVEIKLLLRFSNLSLRTIGEMYNVVLQTVGHIKDGWVWKHITIDDYKELPQYLNDIVQIKIKDRKIREPLSVEKVREIKLLLKHTDKPFTEIANMFDCLIQTIRQINIGIAYSRVLIDGLELAYPIATKRKKKRSEAEIENWRKKVVLEGSFVGERNPSCKITEAQALEVVDRISKGQKQGQIFQEMGVSIPTIKSIRQGKSWSYLTGIKPKNENDNNNVIMCYQ